MSNKPTLGQIIDERAEALLETVAEYQENGNISLLMKAIEKSHKETAHQLTQLMQYVVGEETGYRNRSNKLQRQRAKERGIDL